MKRIKYILASVVLLAAVGCDSYLDTLPDNRAEIDSPEKVEKLLVSAYPTSEYITSTELSTDNVDINGANNPNGSLLQEQLYNWDIITDNANEAPKRVWEACYSAIASANHALQAIEEMGTPEKLLGAKGEALVARAYSHFILVNMFAQHYSEQHSDKDLGITYMREPETELNPKYERGTVKETYKAIEDDLLEGLPLLSKTNYTVPKYHFNQQAGYAFASRFYLYKGDMEQVIKYADLVLGNNPSNLLRDNAYLVSVPESSRYKEYSSPKLKSNLLLTTAVSQVGVMFGPYRNFSRYGHGKMISDNETLQAEGPWGKWSSSTFYLFPHVYGGTNMDKVLYPKLPYLFEYSDPVQGIGLPHTVNVAFSTDETLLNRAEAKIRLKDYAGAVEDMNLWMQAYIKLYKPATVQSLEQWASKFAYYTPERPTPIKKIDPDFAIEAGTQEKLIQSVLYLRRIETLHQGLRWFDIKRYGIEVTRRVIEGNQVASVGSTLVKRDLRAAFQLPDDVLHAGMEPNPR